MCNLCFLANPGKARGCSTNTFVIKLVGEPFPPTALRCRHAQTVRKSSFIYKIDYVIAIKTFLNPEAHQNPISGSTVKVILLKGLILPIGTMVELHLEGLVLDIFWFKLIQNNKVQSFIYNDCFNYIKRIFIYFIFLCVPSLSKILKLCITRYFWLLRSSQLLKHLSSSGSSS